MEALASAQSLGYKEIIFSIGFWSLAAISLAVTIHKFFIAKPETNKLKPWNIRNIDFFLLCILYIFCLILLPHITKALFSYAPTNLSEKWKLLAFAFSIQIPAFLLILIPQASRLTGSLGWKNLPLDRSLIKGIYTLLYAMPLVLGSAFLSFSIIIWLNSIGFNIEPMVQQMVILFLEEDSKLRLVLMVILAAVTAPISEEIIFRGCLYRFLRGRLQVWPSMIISALIFSLMHMNAMAILPLTVVGIILAYAYEKSGDIKVPILFHVFFNANTLITLLVMNWLGKAPS